MRFFRRSSRDHKGRIASQVRSDVDIFERVFLTFIKHAQEWANTGGPTIADTQTELACIFGGHEAGRMAVLAGNLQSAWKGGDSGKALRLSRLFAFNILSRNFSEAGSADEGFRRAAHVTDSICGFQDPLFSPEDFFHLHEQYRWELKQDRPPLLELSVTYHLALEMCGVKTGIDIRSATFPITTFGDLIQNAESAEAYATPEDVLYLANALAFGQDAAARYDEDVGSH